MQCPYPDCQPAEQTSSKDQFCHIADQVYLCSSCGRLSYQCVTGPCDQLNRPYSYCCRKCGKCQFLKSAGCTVANRWYLVDQFDYSWEFKVADNSDVTSARRHEVVSCGEAVVARLGEDTPHARGTSVSGQPISENPVLLESRFLDGLLAVHRGRGFLSLLHPFGDIAESPQNQRVLWFESEGQFLSSAGYQFPQVPYDPQWFRPFPPQMTPDRRAALFSTPYFCAALDLWSLPGWNAAESTRCEILVALNERSGVRIAAAPVPLTIQPWPYNQAGAVDLNRNLKPNRVGLLLRHDNGSYWWCTLSLSRYFAADFPTEAARAEVWQCINDAVAGRTGDREKAVDQENEGSVVEANRPWCISVPIRGEAVQVSWFNDRKIIFATPQGHWIWSPEDAAAGVVTNAQIKERTTNGTEAESVIGGIWEIREPDNSRIELDRQVLDRKNFSWQQQCVFASGSDHVGKFEVAYTVDRSARTRSVWPNDHQRTINSRPIESLKGCRGLFAWAAPPTGRNNELLFVSQDDGAIYRRLITRHDPTRLPNMQVGEINEVGGLQFRDPLMILVRRDSAAGQVGSEETFEVLLRTVRYPADVAVIGGLPLQADPLAWSNFLFTCEAEQARIRVMRREFPIFSHETNQHMSSLQSLGRAVSSSIPLTPNAPPAD